MISSGGDSGDDNGFIGGRFTDDTVNSLFPVQSCYQYQGCSNFAQTLVQHVEVFSTNT